MLLLTKMNLVFQNCKLYSLEGTISIFKNKKKGWTLPTLVDESSTNNIYILFWVNDSLLAIIQSITMAMYWFSISTNDRETEMLLSLTEDLHFKFPKDLT